MSRSAPRVVRFGPFVLNRDTAELRKNETTVHLQEQPLRILETLVERHGSLVTREELRQRLWSADTFVDFDNGLNNAVNRLRAALGDRSGTPRFIQTVGRRGYRLIAPITDAASTLPAGAGQRAKGNRVTNLVVLPFRVLRPDPDVDFLAFSLPDAIAAALSGLDALAVRSSVAAARFATNAPDLFALAEALDVTVVVTGSILRDGSMLRISIQLVEAPAGTLVWTHTADGSLDRLFPLHDSVVRGIVESLALPLSLHDSEALDHDVPASEGGFADYLRANRLSHDPTMLTEARDLYLRAVREDPRYAPSWARLARVCRFMAKFGVDDETDYEARAEEAAQRALTLNPELSYAHYVKAQLELESGRGLAALRRLLDRVRHRRSDPRLFVALVQACRYGGLLDASTAADRRSRALDPMSRSSVAYTYWMSGDPGRALDEGRRVDDMALGLLLVAAGQLDDARVWLANAERRYATFSVSRAYVRALSAFVGGDRRASVEAADAVGRRPTFRDPEGLYYIALVMMWNHQPARALGLLSRSVAAGFACPAALLNEPAWEPLRSSPEFAGLYDVVEERHREFAAAFAAAHGEELLTDC